ncbi:MAG TPA: hypothetical protein VH088_03800 [Terriglobales bacterium]|jgi:hypothetical protein|nr:hypothetical protein [Terriglobales bacterium]
MTVAQTAAFLLQPDEREAVLGDLEEASESVLRSTLGVLGLVIRREASVWKNWRPWLSALGIALPFSFLLMGFSLSVSQRSQSIHYQLIVPVLLLVGWAWTSGFAVGSISRRTLWVNVAACFSPCLFCLSRFHHSSQSRFSLLLFLLPAICGVLRGLRATRFKRTPAIVLAVAITVVTTFSWINGGLWTVDFLMLWPAWYLVAAARKDSAQESPIL